MSSSVRVEERRVRSFDGAEVAYHVVGDGPVVLLANGLGGSWRAWTHQIAYLSDRYRFISWDYRGLYRSPKPASPGALSVEDHARDALEILRVENVDRAAIWGWSMGVQVAVEIFRRAPEQIASIALINGVAGAPFEVVLSAPWMGSALPPAIRVVRALPWLTQTVTRRMALTPEVAGWLKRVRFAAPTLDEDTFHELAASFADLDMGTYMQILEHIGRHDARDVLRTIDVPTLVIAGERDHFAPCRAVLEMAANIPGAETLVVPSGTHYVAIEYPELVGLRLEKFLRERDPRSMVTGGT